MGTINESLDELKRNTDQLRMDTRVILLLIQESRRYVNFLKDDLADRLLNENKNQLSLQIKKL